MVTTPLVTNALGPIGVKSFLEKKVGVVSLSSTGTMNMLIPDPDHIQFTFQKNLYLPVVKRRVVSCNPLSEKIYPNMLWLPEYIASYIGNYSLSSK